uniref:O-fucosyltransferase family protein n=1 Tax=Kalanchoe fedtschenkoi TaxID=63787 RepID=A0A7N0ZX17_KALFE
MCLFNWCILCGCFSYGIAAISPFSHRLAFNNLSAEIQRLRCKVNFRALAFVPHVRALGDAIVGRLRYPPKADDGNYLREVTDRDNGKGTRKFVVLHLRFDKDMAAHSACDFGGGKAEKIALAKYRQTIWQGRVVNSQFTDEELRNQGRCPLTPEEIGLLLAALGFDNSTRLYLASHKVYGGEARLSALRNLFPLMEDKKSLASSEERVQIKGKASLLAAVDYYVSMHSDIFISASPGNMHNAMVGHRTFENLKTIRPNMALLGQLFSNKSLTWPEFQQAVLAGHKGRHGEIRLRKPKQSLYTYPAPDLTVVRNSEVIRLWRLQFLFIGGNSFQGNIPVELSNCANLLQLILAYYNFTGSLPSQLGSLRKPSGFNVVRNNFVGEMPSFLRKFSSLTIESESPQTKNLNSFSDSISPLYNLSTLNLLEISYNHYEGTLRDIDVALPNAFYLKLGVSHLIGSEGRSDSGGQISCCWRDPYTEESLTCLEIPE